MILNKSKIIVTGGSSGIGKATAEMLIHEGAQVLITGRNRAKLEAAAKDMGAIPLCFDIADYAALPDAAAKAAELLGGVDALINNAGIGEFAQLDDVTIDSFERIFATNVFGLTLFTQEIVKIFKAQDKGHIVNIASTAAVKGFAYGTVYAASKFALRGMTQCWQAELRKHNVRVILVNPSEVTTAFNQEGGVERPEQASKLRPVEIAHVIRDALSMDDRGFIPEVTVWATNPK